VVGQPDLGSSALRADSASSISSALPIIATSGRSSGLLVAETIALWNSQVGGDQGLERRGLDHRGVGVLDLAQLRRAAVACRQRAEAGSMISRISFRCSTNPLSGDVAQRQASTSGSSRFQLSLARTRVPMRGRDSTRPLAASTFTDSRSAVRLTPELAAQLFLVRQRLARRAGPADDAPAQLVHDLPVQVAAGIGAGDVGAGRFHAGRGKRVREGRSKRRAG
jgi:hypothetical protein